MFKFLYKSLNKKKLKEIENQGVSVTKINLHYYSLLSEEQTLDDIRIKGQWMIDFVIALHKVKKPVTVMHNKLGEIVFSVYNNRLTVRKNEDSI